MKTTQVEVTINGASYGPHEVPDGLSMNDYLHEYAELTGTKLGCGVGACRACVVILDNDDGTSETIQTCITPAEFFAGKHIRTVEGHAEGGVLTPLQEAFLDHFSFQCGYCSSGFLNEAQVLLVGLAREPVPADQVEARILETMDTHICRCTGYVRYYAAIRDLILRSPGLTV